MGRWDIFADSDKDQVTAEITNDEGNTFWAATNSDAARKVGRLLIEAADHNDQKRERR